eukprot:jgi/Tetstr1/453586/TSEL_003981.t1
MHNGDTFALEVRNDRNRDGGGNNLDNFHKARQGPGAAAPRTATFTIDNAKDYEPPTSIIDDAEAKGPWSELMRGIIEALYGTGDWDTKVFDPLTTSLMVHTYSNYEGELKTNEELRHAPMPCDVITDTLDDLATLLTTIIDDGNILRDGAAVC